MIKLEQAKRLINDNKLNEALEILYQLIKDYPNEESILFELGKVYAFQNNHNKSIEYFEMLLDSENFKDIVYDLLINEYNELNDNIKIFNLYKKIQKENKIIQDDNKKNIVIYAIKNLKKYDEDIFELLSDNKDVFRMFYFSFVSDTLESLKKETNFYAKFKIYKNAVNILKNKVNILIDLKIFKKVSTLIYLDLEEYIERLNSLNKFKEIKFIYYRLKNVIPKYEKKIRNVLFNEYEISKRKIILRSFPRKIELVLTNKCNLRCVMCSTQNHEGNFSVGDKKVEDLIELMPYLERLFLRGGEVFFDKRIYKILEEAKKNRVQVDLITNGILLNEDIINQIIGLETNLTISIDSVIKEKYEKIRVGAKFEQLISNIELLTNIIKEKNADTYLDLNMVVMSINYMEIENILDFAGKYGFKGVQLLPPILSEDRQEYSLNQYIVRLLSQKKHIYSNIAKKYGITLINKLPEVINDKDNVCVINNIDVNNSIDKTEDVNEKKLPDYKSKVQTNMNILDKNDSHKNKTDYKNIKISYNNRLFCLEPFKKIVVDNLQARPTCLCVKENCSDDVCLPVKNNSILNDYNNFNFRKYRESIVLNKYKEVCLKDCIDNIFINNFKNE